MAQRQVGWHDRETGACGKSVAHGGAGEVCGKGLAHN